jgi:hypothetical protein
MVAPRVAAKLAGRDIFLVRGTLERLMLHRCLSEDALGPPVVGVVHHLLDLFGFCLCLTNKISRLVGQPAQLIQRFADFRRHGSILSPGPTGGMQRAMLRA